jgi:hypothetical protein
MNGHFQLRPGSATRRNLPNLVMTATCAVCTVKKLSRPTIRMTTMKGQNSTMPYSKRPMVAARPAGLYDKTRRADQCSLPIKPAERPRHSGLPRSGKSGIHNPKSSGFGTENRLHRS